MKKWIMLILSIFMTLTLAAPAMARAGEPEAAQSAGAYSLTGAAAGSYVLSAQPASVTANITPKSITGAAVALSPTQLQYSGSEQSVSVTGVTLDGKTLIAGVDYEVSGTTGAVAGNYTVTVTGKGNYEGTQTADFSIAKKPVIITGLSVSDKAYDGTETATVIGTATVSGVIGEDEIAVSEGAASFEDRNVGTDKTVSFSGYALTGKAAGNYTLSGQPASVTANITPKSVSVTGITAASRDYDPGNVTVELSGGTIEGIISGDAVSVDLTEAVGTLADENAGRDKPVTVFGVKLDGADAANYALAGQPTGTIVTINRASHGDARAEGSARYGMSSEVDLSGLIEANGRVNYLYVEDPSQIFTVTHGTGDGKLSFRLKDDPALVGKTARLTLTIDNYAMNYVSYRIIVTISVMDREPINPVVSIEGWTYGNTPCEPTVSGNPGDGAVSYEYKLRGADDSAYSGVVPSLAGEYTVRASIAEGGIYAAGTATADFAVSVAELTITAKDQNYIYDGNPHGEADPVYEDPAEIAEKVTISGLADGDALTSVTLTGQGTLAGVYDIEVTGAGVQNADSYSIHYVTGKLTIEKATAVVTKAPTANTLTYDGSAQALVTEADVSGGTMVYSLGMDAITKPADNLYTAAIPTAADAGTYYVWYKAVGDENHEDTEPACITAVIREAPGAAYTVSFDANGGSGAMDKVPDVSGDYELPKCLFKAPKGKAFDCWLAGGREYAEGDKITVDADITVKAQWKDVTPVHVHKLSLVDVADATCTEEGNTEYYTCDGCDLWFEDKTGLVEIRDKSSVIIAPLGHKWGSWVRTKAPTASEEGEETRTCSRCGEKETRSIPKEDAESYAITVSFGAGGSASASVKAAEAGTIVTVTTVPDSGYELAGIRYTPEGGKSEDITTTRRFAMPEADVTVSVTFRKISDEPPVPITRYTVTFDANGHGTAPAAQEVESGEKASEPAALTAGGYTFGGWYKESACTNKFSFKTAITEDITLYAKWTKNSSDDGGGNSSSGRGSGNRSALSYGYWSLGMAGWSYRLGGTPVSDTWRFLPYNGRTYWYYFDENAIMRTGWLDWNGSRYYLYPVSDGWMGRMLTGWQLIDGKWYYFETVAGNNQGRMYRSERTPDGYYVGADGAWDGRPANAGR